MKTTAKIIGVYAVGMVLSFAGIYGICWVTSHLMALLGVA